MDSPEPQSHFYRRRCYVKKKNSEIRVFAIEKERLPDSYAPRRDEDEGSDSCFTFMLKLEGMLLFRTSFLLRASVCELL